MLLYPHAHDLSRPKEQVPSSWGNTGTQIMRMELGQSSLLNWVNFKPKQHKGQIVHQTSNHHSHGEHRRDVCMLVSCEGCSLCNFAPYPCYAQRGLVRCHANWDCFGRGHLRGKLSQGLVEKLLPLILLSEKLKSLYYFSQIRRAQFQWKS